MPPPGSAAAPGVPGSFCDGMFAGEGCEIGRKEAGFLQLAIEIEGLLVRFENLFLYGIVFRSA